MSPTSLNFNPHEARLAAALFERLFPADAQEPGAVEIGVLDYLDRALAGPYQDQLETYRLGLAALDRCARQQYGLSFAGCAAGQQDELLAQLEQGSLPDFRLPPQQAFFALLRAHLQEGLFADPAYGGNRDKRGWRFLKHPGVWLENSPEENLAAEPATKGGLIRSLADWGHDLSTGAPAAAPLEIPGYDPQRGAAPPTGPADVILVGFGGMGSIIAPLLVKAGLRVAALEAGPWYTACDFLPDELGASYYGRANMGAKFRREIPRWRRQASEPTREATFSLGRMRNGVGGSILHYGCWLRRFHPHHFKPLSRVRERWGEQVLPAGATLADWPVTYEELEPYYTDLEYRVGVAGDDRNPFIPRQKPFPMPPLRPFRLGQLFSQVTKDMGLHPYPAPVGLNSVPYAGRPPPTAAGAPVSAPHLAINGTRP